MRATRNLLVTFLLFCASAQASLLIEQEITDPQMQITSSTPLLRIHNVGSQPLFIPDFQLVLEEGESVDVSDTHLYSFFVEAEQGAKVVYSKEEDRVTPALFDLRASRKTSSRPAPAAPFVQPQQVSDEIWAEVQPYLMPLDHPTRRRLDEIFSKNRVLASLEAMKEAGFMLTPQQGVHVHATKHPMLPGYVIKMYPDLHPEREWYKWVKRCQGAELIRDSIARHQMEGIFKVPHKWIYVVPDLFPIEASAGIYPKHFVLVVEDMYILEPHKNRKRYRSEHMHKSTLQALVTIIEDLGLSDAVRCANVPFCQDGKLAFVDTESWHRWPVWYHPMKEWLSIGMRRYWNEITQNPRQGP